jgi:hypothetical protein
MVCLMIYFEIGLILGFIIFLDKQNLGWKACRWRATIVLQADEYCNEVVKH